MAGKQKSCADDKTIYEVFFKTSGRLNRFRYFLRRVVLSVLTKIFLFAGYKVIGYEYGQTTTAAVIYNSAISIIFLIPIFCLTVRRLQDMNQGKLLAVVYVTLNIVTAVAFTDITFTEFKQMDTISPYLVLSLATFSMLMDMYFMISPGSYGKNKYGENPLELEFEKVLSSEKVLETPEIEKKVDLKKSNDNDKK